MSVFVVMIISILYWFTVIYSYPSNKVIESDRCGNIVFCKTLDIPKMQHLRRY